MKNRVAGQLVRRRANSRMAKPKPDASADLFCIDSFHRVIAVRPLLGLRRLVKIQRRKQNGILFCDHLLRVSDTVTFSQSNRRKTPLSIKYKTPALGFLGDCRGSVPNEAGEEEMRVFHDYGNRLTFSFTPERGKTYSAECVIYRPLDTYFGGLQWHLYPDARVANYALSLDLSAYLDVGYWIDPPRCEFESIPARSQRGRAAKSRVRRLNATPKGTGIWQWRVNNETDGCFHLRWASENRDFERAFQSLGFERLATELSVDPRVAKDLHNFMSVCQYFVAGYSSVYAIGRKMAADRTVLLRSVDSIEQLVGAKLIERTERKGSIQITPAGEAVLEWWSRYYMRWTPISPEP